MVTPAEIEPAAAADSQSVPAFLHDNEIGITTGEGFQQITYSHVTGTISITRDYPDSSSYVETFLVKLKDGHSLRLSTEYEFEDNQILNMEVTADGRRSRIQSFLMEQTAGSVDTKNGKLKLKSQICYIAHDLAFRNPVTGVEVVEVVAM